MPGRPSGLGAYAAAGLEGVQVGMAEAGWRVGWEQGVPRFGRDVGDCVEEMEAVPGVHERGREGARVVRRVAVGGSRLGGCLIFEQIEDTLCALQLASAVHCLSTGFHTVAVGYTGPRLHGGCAEAV